MEKTFYIFWYNPEGEVTGFNSYKDMRDLKDMIFHLLQSGKRIIGIVYGSRVKFDVILTNVNDIILTGGEM